MQYVRKVGGAFGTVVLAALAALTIAIAIGWLHVTPILSGSMRGTVNPGDALLTERVPASSLHVGDVVVAKVPAAVSNGAGQRAHRIVSLKREGLSVVVQTKGDANAAADPTSLTLQGDQYVMRARLPYVGWLVDFRAMNGLRLLLAAVGALGLVSLGQHLWLRRRPQPRRGRHHHTVSSTTPAS